MYNSHAPLGFLLVSAVIESASGNLFVPQSRERQRNTLFSLEKFILLLDCSFIFQTSKPCWGDKISSTGAMFSSLWTSYLRCQTRVSGSSGQEKMVCLDLFPGCFAWDRLRPGPWASAVTMCKCSWLQSSGLPLKVQQTIGYLPIEGLTLFSHQTDKLHSCKDSKATLKFVGFILHSLKSNSAISHSTVTSPLHCHNLSRLGEKGRIIGGDYHLLISHPQ